MGREQPSSDGECDPGKGAVGGGGSLERPGRALGPGPPIALHGHLHCSQEQTDAPLPSPHASGTCRGCDFLFSHNIRLRRGYWAKYIVPIIHINRNSIVATCHLLRLEGNIVNIVL